MGRHVREWYPGAIYHVMERGIRRQEIFHGEMDYQLFLMVLQKIMKCYGVKIHAYCLMTNHFHLLIETDQIEIGKAVQVLAGDYAKIFNYQHGYRGHLFEGRYVSCLIKDDTQFLQTSRYIHLNPVKARMVRNPEEYRWSSFTTMIGIADDRITEKDKTLKYFKGKSVQRYRDFVEDIGHKYRVSEEEIRKTIEEDEVWLPW